MFLESSCIWKHTECTNILTVWQNLVNIFSPQDSYSCVLEWIIYSVLSIVGSITLDFPHQKSPLTTYSLFFQCNWDFSYGYSKFCANSLLNSKISLSFPKCSKLQIDYQNSLFSSSGREEKRQLTKLNKLECSSFAYIVNISN